jgi:hypothetical protein
MPISIATRTVAFCLILLVFGGVVEMGSAADVSLRKFDEFHGLNWEDAMARLDNFALDLRNNPSSVGIVLVYGGQDRRRGEARAWSSCIRDYLEKRRGIEANRIVVVKGGYMHRLKAELWKGPDRTNIPKPAPEIKPTDVKFRARPIKQWRSLCSSP